MRQTVPDVGKVSLLLLGNTINFSLKGHKNLGAYKLIVKMFIYLSLIVHLKPLFDVPSDLWNVFSQEGYATNRSIRCN